VNAVGVQQGVEVGAGLGGARSGGEPSGTDQQRQFRCRLVGGIDAMCLDGAAPRLADGMPGLGEPVGGEGGERRSIQLCPSPANGDEGVVADPGYDARLAAIDE
jgi:hypothetical protein